jgi:hypothetical protein
MLAYGNCGPRWIAKEIGCLIDLGRFNCTAEFIEHRLLTVNGTKDPESPESISDESSLPFPNENRYKIGQRNFRSVDGFRRRILAEDTSEGKRSADSDLEGPAKRAKRVTRRPYESVLPEKLEAVLGYWKVEAPVTPDNSQPVDQIAAAITPPEDRNCAAVYIRPGLPPAVPLVSMNQWDGNRVEGGGTQNYGQVYAAGAYEKVAITGDQLHAEMKILQFLFTNVLMETISTSEYPNGAAYVAPLS